MTPEEFNSNHRESLRMGRDRLLAQFAGDPNCTGFGVGYRKRDGRFTDEPVVVATVAKKRPAGYVPRHKILPATMDIGGRSYGVDVIEAGPFTPSEPSFRQDPGDPIIRRMRPARQGSGIANVNGFTIGTFGCLVRDLTDGATCLLSSNHVIASLNRGRPGDVIVQPGDAQPWDPANGIATLKRFVPLRPGFDDTNRADAAIAAITDPALVDTEVADTLMPPISRKHPAVGMLVAFDQFNNGFAAPMADALGALNVELMAPDAVAPIDTIGLHVDKVGRSSGYTASRVTIIDLAVPIEVEHLDDPPFRYSVAGVLIEVFGQWGDSGAVVCAGGDGGRPVDVTICGITCQASLTATSYYGVPITIAETDLADRIRDKFFLQTPVGRLLTQAFYLNLDRLGRVQGQKATPEEKAKADEAYARLHERDWAGFLTHVVDNPDDPTTVTAENLTNLWSAVYGLTLRMNPDESRAATALFNDLARPTLGKNYRQILTFMRDPATYRKAYDTLASVPGLIMRGAV